MKKNNTKILIAIFCFILIGLTACTSNSKTIEGKYVSIYDAEDYLIFKKDHTFQGSLWKTTSAGVTKISDHYIYSIDENNIITVIDTTEYEGQDELNKYEIGIIYKDYICVSLNGNIPKNYKNFTLIKEFPDVNIICTNNFKDDKTYEYTVISDGEVVHTENGTYSINDNEVICTNDEGKIITFVNIDGNPYSIEYVKE